jgi:hypothetical protein
MVSNESPHNGHDVTKIIVEIAETKDVDPIDLDPLYESIDPDAVNALLKKGFSGTIEFSHAGCAVTVHCEAGIDGGASSVSTEIKPKPTEFCEESTLNQG